MSTFRVLSAHFALVTSEFLWVFFLVVGSHPGNFSSRSTTWTSSSQTPCRLSATAPNCRHRGSGGRKDRDVLLAFAIELIQPFNLL